MHARGEVPLILTTEAGGDAGAETLVETQLQWVGAPGGRAWRQRPLRLAFEKTCIFLHSAVSALDRAEIGWEMAVEASNTRTVEALVSADLALHAVLEGHCPSELAPVHHSGALPDLPQIRINMYGADVDRSPAFRLLTELLRNGFGNLRCRDHNLASRAPAA